MDDYLDQEVDKLTGKKTLAVRLERAIVPYTLVLFSLAVSLNSSWALSLFWASYILGMGYDLKNYLPSKLKAYQESLLLLIIGIAFLSVKEIISSLFIIFNIQLIDDLIDRKDDSQIYRNNFTYLLGRRQTIILIIIILSLNIYLEFKKTFLVFSITPLITYLLEDRSDKYNAD